MVYLRCYLLWICDRCAVEVLHWFHKLYFSSLKTIKFWIVNLLESTIFLYQL